MRIVESVRFGRFRGLKVTNVEVRSTIGSRESAASCTVMTDCKGRAENPFKWLSKI
jgi:hypothetical protein